MKMSLQKKMSIALTVVLVTFVSTVGTVKVFAAGPTAGYCATGVPDTFIGGSHNLADVIKYIVCLLENTFIPFLFALAICVFMYGMVKFIGTQEASERESGKQFMLWGIVALSVMLSVWGLVSLIGNTFGVRNAIPQLPVN